MKIDFLYPLILLGLIFIPIIFLISRILPPNPKAIFLPTTKFLKGFETKNNSIKDAPLYLKIIRSLLFAAIIIFFASPVKSLINKQIENNNIAFIIDNSFLNSNNFANIRENINKQIDENNSDAFYYFFLTAQKNQNLTRLNKKQAKEFVNSINIKPNLAYPEIIIKNLHNAQYDKAYFYSDGQEYSSSKEILKTLKSLEINTNKNPISLIINTINDTNFKIISENRNNKPAYEFYKNKQLIHSANTNNINKTLIAGSNYIKIKGQNNAGAIHILDAQSKPRSIGVLENNKTGLGDYNLIIAAINQISKPNTGDVKSLIQNSDTIIIGDYALNNEDQELLENYLKNGGNIIRYIGANAISNPEDKILTVIFDKEPKIVSGDLSSFENYISPFKENSPLYGIEFYKNDKPNIIAKTISEQDAEIYARLNDGSALISGKQIGKGNLINIHTSASPDWSGFALSGLQVKILRHLIAIEPEGKINNLIGNPNLSFNAKLILDGYGNFISPENIVSMPPNIDIQSSNLDYPPGIYEAENYIKIIQAVPKDFKLRPLNTSGIKEINMEKSGLSNYSKILIFIICILLFMDNILSSRMKKFNAIWLLFFLFPLPNQANAQNIALPYIVSNDTSHDNKAKLGLGALANALKERTNYEPIGAIGIDLNTIDIQKYPIIYWYLPNNMQALSQANKIKLNQYINNGGILFIDTRGQSRSSVSSNNILGLAISGLNIPNLEAIKSESVLFKSYYLLNSFYGRYGNCEIKIANQSFLKTQNDGVSPIIITNGDFAEAWAKPNGEMAIRSGINIYIYALTGQYKNDQTHLNALLSRLKPKKQN